MLFSVTYSSFAFSVQFRRIDIILVPYNEFPLALLHFTGSGHFNRSMRNKANIMVGMVAILLTVSLFVASYRGCPFPSMVFALGSSERYLFSVGSYNVYATLV